MLDTLTKAPELHGNNRAKNTQQQTSELADDPASALRLDNDFLVNQAHLGTPCKTTVAKSDPDAPSTDIANILAYCNKEVRRIRRTTNPQPHLQHILRSNSDLLFKYVLVLKDHRPLSKSLYSVFRKLVLLKPIAGKLIKKVISALVRHDFVDIQWTYKYTVDFNVHLANSGPLLSFYLNGHLTEGVLDTGSTFTLVPYKFWKTLKINQSMLNTSTNFNINSASHCNKDAVLGQIVLTFKVCNEKGDEQVIEQNCLILRPELDLQLILLGNDFLTTNSVIIEYSGGPTPIVSINEQKIPLSQTLEAHLVFPSYPAISEEIRESKTELPEDDHLDDHRADDFFHLNSDFEMVNIASFLQTCKEAKKKFYKEQEAIAYSIQPATLDDMVNNDFEKKSIIPDPGSKNPSSKISHLS